MYMTDPRRREAIALWGDTLVRLNHAENEYDATPRWRFLKRARMGPYLRILRRQCLAAANEVRVIERELR